MTQEIIQMARDSGMELYGLGKNRARFVHHLEAFAKLVAEKALAEHAMQEVQRLGQEIEQEPVAIVHIKDDCLVGSHRDNSKPFPDGQYGLWPIGTTPPQRTWVGLNDDEIDYLIHLAYTGDEEFVQTIEAKLKEKNLTCIKPKWIGLTEKEHINIAVECGCMSADWVFYGAAVERKLKERNT
jgi:hypothetical protein